MENASKALLIAASLLIAVLLVAFGVTIFNNARNAADMKQFDQAEITMFNQQFEKYVSNTGILGSQVKTLLSTAIANASTNKEEELKLPRIRYYKDVTQFNADNPEVSTIYGETACGSNIQTYINAISGIRNNNITSNINYKVSCEYATNGLVNIINIVNLS